MMLTKLDVGAREAFDRDEPQARAEVLVRVNGSARSVRGELEQTGLEVHTTTGPIASGVISTHDLRLLASLPCVRRVELSRLLYAERP